MFFFVIGAIQIRDDDDDDEMRRNFRHDIRDWRRIVSLTVEPGKRTYGEFSCCR